MKWLGHSTLIHDIHAKLKISKIKISIQVSPYYLLITLRVDTKFQSHGFSDPDF